jgi:hypothetical protein
MIEQETVDLVDTLVRSQDLARWGYPSDQGTFHAQRHVERGVDAVIEQESVLIIGSIHVISQDLARWVYRKGHGKKVRAGHVERGVDAVIEQETEPGTSSVV